MASNSVLALDVGSKRVGLAIVRDGVTIAQPLTTLQREDRDFWQQLQGIVQEQSPETLVVGLPRGLDGQETPQTAAVRHFVDELATYTALPVIWQDEALTSVKAKETLQARGVPYDKAEVDALAATYILTDYIEEQMKVHE